MGHSVSFLGALHGINALVLFSTAAARTRWSSSGS